MSAVMTEVGACKWLSLNSPFFGLLILDLVGFYAALNLIAWFMIFCFVRET